MGLKTIKLKNCRPFQVFNPQVLNSWAFKSGIRLFSHLFHVFFSYFVSFLSPFFVNSKAFKIRLFEVFFQCFCEQVFLLIEHSVYCSQRCYSPCSAAKIFSLEIENRIDVLLHQGIFSRVLTSHMEKLST